MKTRKSIFFVVVLFLMGGAASGSALADQIVLASDNWCPFNCEPESQNPGYMIEIARAAFEPLGHTVTYTLVPWSRAIKDTRRGKYQGIIGGYKSDAPDFIYPENELGMIGMSIFVTKDAEWKYTGLDSLSVISLGVIRDYEYSTEINRYIDEHLGEANRIQMLSGDEPLAINIRKLIRGRIDALIETPPVLWYTAKELGVTDELKSAGVAVEAKKAYIAFSPAEPEKSKKYAQILSETVERLRKSKKLETILEKYGLTDWKSSAPAE